MSVQYRRLDIFSFGKDPKPTSTGLVCTGRSLHPDTGDIVVCNGHVNIAGIFYRFGKLLKHSFYVAIPERVLCVRVLQCFSHYMPRQVSTRFDVGANASFATDPSTVTT